MRGWKNVGSMLSLLLVVGLPATQAAGQGGSETIWRHMQPDRFPENAEARQAKCLAIAAQDASGAITASWCRKLEDAYQAYLENPATAEHCSASIERDGQRYQYGTTGSLDAIEVLSGVVKQTERDDMVVRCEVDGITAVYFNEDDVGCNNLNIVLEVAATPPSEPECRWVEEDASVVPGMTHRTPGLDVCGCVDLPGQSYRTGPSIETSSRMVCE